MTTRRFTDDEYRRIAAFRIELRRFLHISEEAARAEHLTPQQHQALLAVRGAPSGAPPTVGQLADWLQIRPHSAFELVSRMVERNLLRRLPSEDDRRRVCLALTVHGAERLERLTEAHRAELRRLGESIIEAARSLDREDPGRGSDSAADSMNRDGAESGS